MGRKVIYVELSRHCMDRWMERVGTAGGYPYQLKNIQNYYSPESYLWYYEDYNRYILSRFEIEPKNLFLQNYLVLEEHRKPNPKQELYVAKTVLNRRSVRRKRLRKELLKLKFMKSVSPRFFYLKYLS